MPRESSVRPGNLVLLILRVLQSGPLHGYAIAQRIHTLSREALEIEEGSLYPALQKLLLKGWVKASWTQSESGRRVRSYRLTRSGREQLEVEVRDFERVTQAIRDVLRTA
jgi:PadR family transcriptional regulator PadR